MVRGIERTTVFRDDRDRADFIARLARLAEAGAVTVYAWALLPNHAHLLVRTGARPLPRSMRSLLTGYAGAFNRRHTRVGHLFQNRYRSIVVEAAPYLLEVVRYLHLNPLRAHVVPGLRALARYPWTGHSALLGAVPRPWQATAAILAQFGPTLPRARRAYRTFVADGSPQGRRPDLQGGGLVRSVGGWGSLLALRQSRAAYAGDARILGSSQFVAQMQREGASPPHPSPYSAPSRASARGSARMWGFQPRRSRGAAGCRRSRVRARGSPTFGWSAWAARGGLSRPCWAFTRLPCIRRPAGGQPRPRSGNNS